MSTTVINPSISVQIEPADGNRIYQYMAAILANLGVVCSSMHYGWSSHFIPQLENGNYTVHITSEEASWLTVIPLIGDILGTFITYFLVDILGRKWLIVFSSLPFIASWLFVGLAGSSILMFVGRFLAGLADGLACTVVPMYLAEIAQAEIRGFIVSFCPCMIVFGLLLINIFGAFMSLQATAYVATALPVLLLITFPWMPESPYFYLMKRDTDGARGSLQTFTGSDNVTADLQRIYVAVSEQNENKGSFFDLVRVRSIRKGTIVCAGLKCIQQFSGITVITFYCQTVFEESRALLDPSTSTMIYFSLNLCMTFISSFVVDLFGRRPLLIVSILGTGLSLFVMGTYLYLKNCTDVDMTGLHFIPIVGLFCYVVTFSIGLQTVPYFIVGEMFPTNVKAHANCSLIIFHSSILLVISKFFHWSNLTFGMHVPFFAFTACCVFGLVFLISYVPETKGKTLEDIQTELCGYVKIIDRKGCDGKKDVRRESIYKRHLQIPGEKAFEKSGLFSL